MNDAIGRLGVIGKRSALAAIALVALIAAARSSPATAEASSPLGPLTAYRLSAPDRVRFDARVLERVRAGSYTYLLLERAGGRRSWAVTLASSVGAQPRTERVSILAVGYAAHFRSKRLARDFEGLYFAVVRPA